MEDRILTSLVATSRRLMAWARKFPKKRFIYPELRRIDEEYYIGIKGLRGVGKTVLMLQFAMETSKSLYFSADSTLIKPFSLYEVVKAFSTLGYRNIFIDEIHRKPGWAEDLKTLYDEHEVRIFFSGSSTIDILHSGADLSRRVVLRELPPTSFREWLNIRKGMEVPIHRLEEVISKPFDLTNMYMELHVLWREYMERGGVLYPESGFYDTLENSVRKVILEDLSALREISVKYETDAYRLLYLVAKSAPFEVNYSLIARELGVSKNMAIRLVDDLSKAGLIYALQPCDNVRREPKLYLTVPLRMFFAKKGFNVHLGALREEFFINHLRWVTEPCYLKGKRGEKTADFKVGDWVIEVGGERKRRYQKQDYTAVDGLLTGNSRIPLFLFGLIY